MKTKTSIAIFQGLFFGVIMTIFFSLSSQNFAWIQGMFSGVLFGLSMYFFNSSKKIDEQTKLEDIDPEAIIYSDLANHYKGLEAVGGKLYLLNDRVIFKSHQGNIQNHRLDIPLSKIKEVNRQKTLGIIPNKLSLKTEISDEKFIVYNTKNWKVLLNEASLYSGSP